MAFIRLALACCLCLTSCTSKALRSRREAARAAAETVARESIERPEYRIGPGDSLRIEHRFNEELNRVVVVRPDGFASLPLLPDVRLADRTLAEARQQLEEQYARTVRTPKVSVALENSSARICVGGEVLNPGLFPMADGLTPLRAIALAGGPRHTARLSSVVVLRDRGQLEPQYLLVDVSRGPERLEGHAELRLQPKDMVFVTRSTIANMNSFVDLYLNQLIPFSKNLGVTYFIGGKGLQ